MNLLRLSGAQPRNRQPSFAPIFIDRTFTGLFTQRSALHDPSDMVTSRFYGGRPDALIGGSNVELTNRLTLARRPGLIPFSATTYPDAPNRAFEFRRADGTIQVLIDTPTHIYLDNQNGTKTNILTKATGAGQGYFTSVGDVCYIGDGVDLIKYTPWNTNGITWNWGIAAPTSAPTVTITPSGSSAVSWTASVVYPTMGLLDDGANIQQLISVNADGTNPSSQIGTTSSGQPNWNQAPPGTTTEATGTPIVWKNFGIISDWTPNTVYANASVGGTLTKSCIIYDKTSDSCYISAMPSNADGQSAGTRPPFNGGVGSSFYEYKQNANGTLFSPLTLINKWFILGAKKSPPVWTPSTAYLSYGGGNDDSKGSISEPVGPKAAGIGGTTPQQIFFQIATNGGTSGTGGTAPKWSTTPNTTTDDKQLRWKCLGPRTWAASTAYTAWSGSGSLFSAIKDSNNNFQVCVTSGSSNTVQPSTVDTLTAAANASGGNTSYTGTFSPVLPPNYPVTIAGFVTTANNGSFTIVSCNATTLVVNNPAGVAETHAGTATFNPWGTTYQANTNDGSATWVCVGASISWVASTQWYLPVVGFVPPSQTQAYGGASIKDSNGNIQYVTSSGKSNTVQPTWATTVGATTTDNAATWTMTGAASTNSLAWTKSHVYAISFKCRKPTDTYVTTAPPGSATGALGAYTGGGTGAISTASPVATLSGANTGAVNTITITGSTDPQVDTIVIWRDADGGGSSAMFELTEIPNPPLVNGIAGTTNFQDFLPDVPTGTFPGLNQLIPAPINGTNNPPQSGYLPMAFHFQRIWGAIGNTVFFSGGPDVITGNPNEAFLASDDFPFLSTVTRLVHTSSGLLTFLSSDIEVIAGGPLTASFYNTTIAPGVGMLSYNALDIHGGIIYFFSADGQFCTFDPSLSVSRAGFPIGDKLAAFNPSNVYVTVHESGIDNCVFVSDGSTGWYRLNPHQAPQGEAIWSPFATITGGCKMVQSVEVTKGVHKLLVGGTGAAQNILQRDLTTFSDNSTPYDANFIMGSIILAHSGEMAETGFIEADFANGSTPTVGFLLDEISGAFTSFTASVLDPPALYGPAPASYQPNRYYFAQTAQPAYCRHLQIKVDFGTATTADEILNLTIFGKLYAER